MNTLHFSYSFKLWTNACNCELPTLWLPVPRLHQPKLSNGITVSFHGSLPATDQKFISLDVRLLSLFHPCDGCDCCHGVRLEISILWPKFCHPEHNQKRGKRREEENQFFFFLNQRIVILSVKGRKCSATVIQMSTKVRSGGCCGIYGPIWQMQRQVLFLYKLGTLVAN